MQRLHKIIPNDVVAYPLYRYNSSTLEKQVPNSVTGNRTINTGYYRYWDGGVVEAKTRCPRNQQWAKGRINRPLKGRAGRSFYRDVSNHLKKKPPSVCAAQAIGAFHRLLILAWLLFCFVLFSFWFRCGCCYSCNVAVVVLLLL